MPRKPEIPFDKTLAQRAATVAGWPGVALARIHLNDHPVYPIIDALHADWDHRIARWQRPELDRFTLDLWEAIPELGVPPTPLRIIGLICAATSFTDALRALPALDQLGPTLLLHRGPRGPRESAMRRASAARAGVVWARPDHTLTALLDHRHQRTRRTVTDRYLEELLFGHALAYTGPTARDTVDHRSELPRRDIR
ncbi:hypothetical protein [Nocardia altamirensis]|uniref:hypothetical protein n=1 Tax=Nocardia altamirensis TaxID=472158 RepID=UPI0008400342|nr:hypothetical protein [Nocardia altamirensis]